MMRQDIMVSDGRTSGGVYRYYVLVLLMLTFMFNIADRLVMSILIEDIKAEFVLSDTQIGLLAGTAFTVFYLILGVPAGRLADRTNRKNMVAIALALWSLMSALCGAALGFWTLLLARLGVGVGEAGGGPPSVSIITDYFAPHELSRAMGIFAVGAVLGPVLGYMAGGLIAEAYGWRWTFVILGVPGILLGIILFLTIREPKRGRYFTPEAKPTGADKGAEKQEPFMTTMGSLWTNSVFFRVVLANSFTNIPSFAFAIWLAPMLMRNFDVGSGEVGVYLGTVLFFGGVPGMILGGFLADYLAKKNPKWRPWYCSVAVLLVLPFWTLCLLSDSLEMTLFLYISGYVLLVSTQGAAISMVQSAVLPTERGTASSISSLSINLLGYGIGPALIGLMSDNWADAYGTMSLSYAVIVTVVFSLAIATFLFWWTGKAVNSGLAKV
ncbi:spinster family MFS transporter [Parasphingorhabdus halotolerans]|uniref:MFS transporter n=1 Tax=Parasphingorhabdus halotolerans TaxID=2725558 RepID=A0A6H2DMB6_9SPHN|nr:MFS transporter [Parasphingorhabdus halotolerans]QJB69494.1 MFS transporter [Parasphingorhabdus halotolerans]